MTYFKPPAKYGERSRRIRDAQYVLRYNRFRRHFYTGKIDSIFGEQMWRGTEEARYELGYPMDALTGKTYGHELHAYLLGPHKGGSRLPAAFLARAKKRAGKRFITPGQSVILPKYVHFPNVAYPPVFNSLDGLQHWIAPQVRAICKHFDLRLTDGYGGHPPHAYYSDHRWGGACDLAGTYQNMVKATLWGDSLCSGYYREGKVFRWVGGPAHDANGVEPGHYNHVHLSWYRLGPATSCLRGDGSLKGT